MIGLALTLLLAQSPASLPQLTAPVTDLAGVIDSQSEAEIDRRIRALQRATSDVIVVVTVDTFSPYADIDEYAVKLFENHGQGIGIKGKDNGALIVVAVNDRRVRVEVGYGLEEFITDGFAGETRDVMTQYFRRNEYGQGLLAGVTRLVNRVAERRGVKLEDVPQEIAEPSNLPVGQLFLIAIIILIIISSLSRRRPRRRYWGRGPWSGWNSGVGPFGGGPWGGGFGGFGGSGGFGGGGGFGGFGGGRSGGGGASGGW